MSCPYPSLPSPASITASQFTNLLALYPSTVRVVYQQNARLRDPQKLAKALEDDHWRYDELPVIVSARKSSGRVGKDGGSEPWLEKAELERLVNWKITHGAHRPFLPGLIRQNSPEAIKSTTKSVFSGIIAVDAVNVCPDAALSALTKPLKGVGPATATLLLAICAPDDILYFSDELYAWLVSPHQSSSTNKLKLKYDVKEYRCLFEAWLEFWHSSLSRGLRDVKAVDVEKAAYVLGHWDGLAPADKKKVFLEEAEISKGMGESKEEVRVIGAGITDEGKTRDDHADATAGGIRAAGRETSKRMAAAGESEKESPKKNQTAATSGHIKNNVPVEEGKRSVSEHDSMRRSKRLRRR